MRAIVKYTSDGCLRVTSIEMPRPFLLGILGNIAVSKKMIKSGEKAEKSKIASTNPLLSWWSMVPKSHVPVPFH